MFASVRLIARTTGQATLAAAAAMAVSAICGAALVFTLVCAPPLHRLRG